MKSTNLIGIVGATGVVGLEARKLAAELLKGLNFELLLFASTARPDEQIHALEAAADRLRSCDYVVNAAGADQARFIREHLKPGAVLIDNSSAFRMEAGVPLVVPEVNGHELAGAARGEQAVVANPNCTAALLCVALKALQPFGIERVIVSTYQAASGAGIKGLEELESQLKNAFASPTSWSTEVFKHPLLLNVLSHNSPVLPENAPFAALYNEEESKVIEESRKMLGQAKLRISATCVRVPVRRAHTEAVTVDLARDVPLGELREAFAHAAGVHVVDDAARNHFPMPLESQDQDLVLVGRIRKDVSDARTCHFLLSGDQLRKGAASNALQILREIARLRG
jgi:aspartate-semialdehyde dehydrogenase